jgi:aminoglycoside phosphotransferase (APT) family kinase protein
MATGAQRDRRQLEEGIARWVAGHPDLVPGSVSGGVGGVAEVTGVQHAEGGMANETVMVDLDHGHPGVVVRLAPLTPTFPDYDLSIQAAVQNAVAAGGIPAPAPSVFVDDPRWIGTPFMVMPRISGFIPGAAPLFDPAIVGATPERQRKYHDGLFDVLARLHAVDWSRSTALGNVLPGPTVARALERWTSYVEWAGAGSPLPVLTQALSWCRSHRPDDGPGTGAVVLLWGDARLGNLIFDDDAEVRAVLDWDLAAIGPPEMDLGWYFGLEFMMQQLFGQRVPGFPDRAAAVERYQASSGRAVANLDWHEVFALLRALAINDRHQRIADEERQQATGRPPSPRRVQNPMIDVLAARLATAG